MIELNLFPGGKHHVLTMSFDDGKDADRRLVEIFNKYGIKGTFHLVSSWLDRENFITSDEVEELYKGHEVSGHTVNHYDLTKLSEDEIKSEVSEGVAALEKLCGYPVRGFSLPYGVRNENVDKVLKECGICYSRTGNFTPAFSLPEDFICWNPDCHQSEAEQFVDMFVDAQDDPSKCTMLYIMGHSYEFPRDNTWDYMEELCRKLSNLKDTWYATNIEIYDYCEAVGKLQIASDEKSIYNPSQIDVWVSIDSISTLIKSGETHIITQ